jgi:hypothetical protein
MLYMNITLHRIIRASGGCFHPILAVNGKVSLTTQPEEKKPGDSFLPVIWLSSYK